MDGAELPIALNLPTQPQSVTEARRSAARLAEAVGADRDAVELAVAEAVGNAVLHGYPEGSAGVVTVDARVEADALVVVVTDDGSGMRPNPGSRGQGFGLPLIAQLSREVQISERAGGGTELRMRFPANAGEASEVGR